MPQILANNRTNIMIMHPDHHNHCHSSHLCHYANKHFLSTFFLAIVFPFLARKTCCAIPQVRRNTAVEGNSQITERKFLLSQVTMIISSIKCASSPLFSLEGPSSTSQLSWSGTSLQFPDCSAFPPRRICRQCSYIPSQLSFCQVKKYQLCLCRKHQFLMTLRQPVLAKSSWT